MAGEVGSPGIIRFGPGELRTLMRAIFKAGGFTQFAKKDAIRIIRYERDQSRSELVVDAEEIMDKGYLHKDIELQPGDMLIVPQKRVNF
jgi:protein involved in polysaccharide export with SLBB domain